MSVPSLSGGSCQAAGTRPVWRSPTRRQQALQTQATRVAAPSTLPPAAAAVVPAPEPPSAPATNAQVSPAALAPKNVSEKEKGKKKNKKKKQRQLGDDNGQLNGKQDGNAKVDPYGGIVPTADSTVPSTTSGASSGVAEASSGTSTIKEQLAKRLTATQKELLRMQLRAKARQLEQLRARLPGGQQPVVQRSMTASRQASPAVVKIKAMSVATGGTQSVRRPPQQSSVKDAVHRYQDKIAEQRRLLRLAIARRAAASRTGAVDQVVVLGGK